VFGNHKPYVSAYKSAIGHTLGAAGALELIFTVQALNNSIIPKIRNLENP
jgi:beta-ketoacyl ACP synthase